MTVLENTATRYLQLAETLAQAIHEGALLPGSRLPAVRRCAASHDVSVNTVLAAYRHLEDRALIEARPQSGYYVRGVLPALAAPRQKKARVATPGNERRELIETVFAAQNHPDYTNISLACPQNSDFYPVQKLARITASLLRRKPDLIGKYALPPGSQRLRTEIARRAQTLGMSLQGDDITLTHGCMEALQLALRAVTQPGDCVGVESPTYFFLFPLLSSLGLKTVEIPTHPEQGIALDAVELLLQEKRIQALLVMPTVQNPLGFTMPVEHKRRLAKLVNQHQIPLIEDGLYGELQFTTPLSPAVKHFDDAGWVIYCASYTKTLAPDYRIGWMAAGRFAPALAQLKSVSSMSESVLLSEALAEFLESGGYDNHLRRMRLRYARQLDEARGLIARYFPPGTRATLPAGGFVFWVELPESVDTVTLFHRLLQEQICVTPGPLYTLSERGNHALRLSCCYPFDERYVWAIRRTGQLACELGGYPASTESTTHTLE